MRVRLKGLNSVAKRLADGSTRTYYYAWKGGPPVQGEYGSPQFVASFNEAVEKKVEPAAGTLTTLIRAFETTSVFDALAERTKDDYRKKIVLIENEFGDFPIAALSDPQARGVFKDWRDGLAKKSKRQADYAWTVLGHILSVAKDRAKITVNPCERGGRLYKGTRRDKVWSFEDEARFLSKAPPRIALAFLLAIWTGQRQGDLLKLPWSAYDDERIRLRPSKYKGLVSIDIPVGKPLKLALDEAALRKTSPTILTTTKGTPWTEDGFHSSWWKERAKAGIVGLTFNDLRGSAVTRLALAGATEPEIATFTGHSLRGVREILDKHYLSRDPKLADSAMAKLEKMVAEMNRRAG